MENFKNYVKDRIVSSLEAVMLFEKKVDDDTKTFEKAVEDIKAIKRSTPDITFSDVKEKLIEIQVLNYHLRFYTEDYKRLVDGIAELSMLATITKIDLGLSEEQSKMLQIIEVNNTTIFSFEKGNPVVVNEEIYNLITTSVQEEVKKESTLKTLFDSPMFSVKS